MAMLDENGIHIPTYEELVEQYTAEAKKVHGDDVNTDANSVIGHKIRTDAWMFANIYQLIEANYFNQYVDSSDSVNLDMLGQGNYSVSRLPATSSTVDVEFTGTPNAVVPAESVIATEDDVEFEVVNDVTIDSTGTGKGMAQSSEKSSNTNVSANTITALVDQPNGIDSVNNPTNAAGGSDQESDQDYRDRIHLSNESPGGGTKNGITSALLKVPGVQLVDSDWNKDLDNTNENGTAPGSVQFFVQGGRKEDIGQALFNSYGFGVHTSGNVEYVATDEGGHKQSIYFSESKPINIYAKITLQVNANFDDTNSVDDLKKSIADYVANVPMGNPIKYKQFIKLALNIDSVDDADILIGSDSNNLQAKDVQMESFNSGVVTNPQTDLVVVVQNE
ncbi:baseplate J/gp47 family protein [Apilactobacillus timberlakei]|uniref:baseplate J/gp47 family protein n=1 Tax=Apilactobacillus timberlakei TaxID=2008380 RepID=UPI00112EE2E7|nr:baseplate J/gp47 family protein [Apilactobacillus timberlakei]TPR21721.1 hypothetical protein DY061_00690 [Apilactobacillus timberlakei]TPR22967.1 hypothetical protein DY083_02510 [Apilactobacillus timberlakei]